MGGEFLLDLQAAGENFHHAGEFGNANDAIAWQVADMYFADDGQKVVFALGDKVNIGEQDNFVIACGFGEGAAQERQGVLGVALGAFFKGADYAGGGFE